MENYNIILGFLQCLGIEELMGCAWPTGKIEYHYDIPAVVITGLFGVETKICKHAYSDSILTDSGLGIQQYSFNRADVERRYTAAHHRRDDAAGKKREQEMTDKEYGARIALALIGE